MEQKQGNDILNEKFKNLSLSDLVKSDKTQEQVIQIIDSIENMMKDYSKKITYTQMRNIYAILKRAENVIELHRTRPRIAYIQARLDGEKAKSFASFIIDIMKVVKTEEQLKEFNVLMQSMVAYHRLYGK